MPREGILSVVFLCVALAPGQTRARKTEKYRGHTVMAGGLGQRPRGEKQMWGNTVAAQLAFVARARTNLVVVEVPYGVNETHPKSPGTRRFIEKLRARGVTVWIVYPHVLAQTFDLPRQVDSAGKRVEWNACNNHPEVQDWLVANAKSIVEAYEPDGLLLFGTFHVGGVCRCELCKTSEDARKGRAQETFFERWSREVRKLAPRIELGTCDFWTRPTKRTLASIDFVSPVVPIFRPGYAGPGQVEKKLSGLRSRYRGKLLVPYVKLFLATQTNSKTDDLLAAAEEALRYGDGFFFWGYNPGHSYAKQHYDHERIQQALAEMAGKKPKRR